VHLIASTIGCRPCRSGERAHRFLEDHRDAVAGSLRRALSGIQDVLAVIVDARPGRDSRPPRQQPHDVRAVTDLPEPDSPTIAIVSRDRAETRFLTASDDACST